MLNNVPQPTQSLGQTQSLINANFSTIDTAFSINHVPYNDPSGNQGKHNLVDFPVQTVAPTLAAGDVGIYNLNNATTTKNEAYIHKITGATTINIPFTASTLSANSTPTSGSGVWTYLPSGVIMLTGNGTGSGLTTVTFGGAGIPALTQILNVIICRSTQGVTTDTNTDVAFVDIVAVNQFRVFVSARTTVGAASGAFRYMVWGY